MVTIMVWYEMFTPEKSTAESYNSRCNQVSSGMVCEALKKSGFWIQDQEKKEVKNLKAEELVIYFQRHSAKKIRFKSDE